MSSALIERLSRELGYAVVDVDSIDGFLDRHPESVLFFTENPASFPESDDVAVILPELIAAFNGRITPAVVARDAERILQKRFHFQRWPTLVFCRGDGYLGAISRVRDWSDYIDEINNILAGEPHPAPQPQWPAAIAERNRREQEQEQYQ
jgi:hydrogenase-1 operon protein HyaE